MNQKTVIVTGAVSGISLVIGLQPWSEHHNYWYDCSAFEIKNGSRNSKNEKATNARKFPLSAYGSM